MPKTTTVPARQPSPTLHENRMGSAGEMHNVSEERPIADEKSLWNRIFNTVYNEAADFVEQEISVAKEKVATSAKTAVSDAIPLVMAAVAVLVALLLLLVGVGAAVGVLFTYVGLDPLAAAAAGMLSTAAVITAIALLTIKWAINKFRSRDLIPDTDKDQKGN